MDNNISNQPINHTSETPPAPPTQTPKYFPIVVFIFIITVVLIALVITIFTHSQSDPTNQITTPPAPQISSRHPTTTVATITFAGSLPNTPDNFPLYQTQQDTSLSGFAQQLATTLNLQPIPQLNTVWISQDQNITLSLVEDQQQLNLSLSNNPDLNDLKPLDTQTTINAAQQFLNSLQLNLELSPNPDNIISTEYSLEPNLNSNLPGSTLVVVPFSQTLNGLPLFYSSQQSNTARVWVGPQYSILKVVFSLPVPPPIQAGSSKPLNEETILQTIKNNQGTIISINSQIPTTTDYSQLQTVILSRSQLEYRLSPTNNFVYPYYHFFGTTTLDTDTPATIEIITPAIATQ